ncbi:MAG: M1 family metallopeptidase [Flavobacteriales bacterium]|nr:M1 family metallopeptidase [Flavobacteriales bacterium]
MKSISAVLLSLFTLTSFAQTSHHYCSKFKGSVEGKRLVIEDLRVDSIDIVHTRIELDFTRMSEKMMEGQATLSLKALMPDVKKIRLDFEGLVVDSVSAKGLASFQHKGPLLELTFSRPILTSQLVEVTIYYSGSPKKDPSGWGGFYFTDDYAWNLGVGFGADPHSYGRVWFPCFDNFIERSSFEFSIVAPSDRFAVCNGLLQDTVHRSDGSIQYHWLLDDPIPSYLACVAIGPYTALNSMHEGVGGAFPVQLFAPPSDTADLSASFVHLHEAITAFEEAYGAYKFNKVGYSLVPFFAGAMEHATNITYPIYAANGGLGSESLMSHELAHMWWGNSVTCETDGDMWINEGWASFSEYIFDEYVYGRGAYVEHMLTDLRYMLQFGHHKEGGYRPVSGQPHEYVYGDHVYKKGALVAHNLRGYLGDALFFEAAKAFIEAYPFSPVSSDSLERFWSAHTGVDLAFFFRDWVFNPGWNALVLDSFTTVSVESEYEVTLYVQQKLKGTARFHDEVPLHYSMYDAHWNRITGSSVVSGKYGEVKITSAIKPGWIVLNEENKLAQASTVDQLLIKSSGSFSLKNMSWDVDVTAVEDSALIRFEQVWSSPDPMQNRSGRKYNLADNRYWRVSGLDWEKVTMDGQFFYDGRAGQNLDASLLHETEDNLVLLYRFSAASDWEEYAYYSKNVLGKNANRIGLIQLTRILPGEYTLANRVMGAKDPGLIRVDGSVSIVANLLDGTVRVEDSDLRVDQLRVYSPQGKLIQSIPIAKKRTEVDLGATLSEGVMYELIGKKSEVLAAGELTTN